MCWSCSRGSAVDSAGTVCNMPWTKPQHLNTVIRARAGYWLNYTWKRRHLREARGLNIMINYGLMRGDKSQLNKNNTGLHAAGEESVFNAHLHFPFHTQEKWKVAECFRKALIPQGAFICCREGANRIRTSSSWQPHSLFSPEHRGQLAFSECRREKNMFGEKENGLFWTRQGMRTCVISLWLYV